MKHWICLSLVVSLAVLGTACNRGSEKAAVESRRRDQLQNLLRDKSEELNDKRVELDRLTHRAGDPDSPEWKVKFDALNQQIRGLGVGKASAANVIVELQVRRDIIVARYEEAACPHPPYPLLVKQLIEDQNLRSEMSQLLAARRRGTLTADDPIRRELRRIREWASATLDQLDEIRVRVQVEVKAQLATRSYADSAADAIDQIDSARVQWNDVVSTIDMRIAEASEKLKEFEQQTAMVRQRALEVEQLVEMTNTLSAELQSLE